MTPIIFFVMYFQSLWEMAHGLIKQNKIRFANNEFMLRNLFGGPFFSGGGGNKFITSV